jgi:hypothetical protein
VADGEAFQDAGFGQDSHFCLALFSFTVYPNRDHTARNGGVGMGWIAVTLAAISMAFSAAVIACIDDARF